MTTIRDTDTGSKSQSDAAARLLALFAGNERKHGEFYPIVAVSPGEKVEKKKALTLEPGANVDLWRRHLAGDFILGVIPIRGDATCWWGVIDIDVYRDFDIKALAKHVADTPLVVCRSKSGGGHVFCFVTEPVAAATMQAKLREVSVALGHPKAEVFPKQTKLGPGEDGNWLNMPYYKGEFSLQHGVTPTNEALIIQEFLDYAEGKRATPDALSALTVVAASDPSAKAAFADGPPCLQSLVAHGISSYRNNALVSVGVYLRKRFPDDWAARLPDYNDRFVNPPLSDDEVRSIAKSLNKKDYRYKCKDEPICSVCDSKTCVTRKYGVGDGEGKKPLRPLIGLIVPLPEFMAIPCDPRESIVDNFIRTQSLNMVWGWRGGGKTYWCVALARAIAMGERFLGHYDVPKARRVLYIDGELPTAVIQERFRVICGNDLPALVDILGSEKLRIEGDGDEDRIEPLNINDPDHQAWIEQALTDLEAVERRPDLIIFDNWSSLAPAGDENSNSELNSVLQWLMRLRHKGFAVLLVHHAGKNRDQRGGSRREDLLDTSINIAETAMFDNLPPPVGDGTNARFVMVFTKTRDRRPSPDTLLCELWFTDDQDRETFYVEPLTEKRGEQLTELLRLIYVNRPKVQEDLAKAMKVSEATITRRLNKARDAGLINKKGMALTTDGLRWLRDHGVTVTLPEDQGSIV